MKDWNSFHTSRPLRIYMILKSWIFYLFCQFNMERFITANYNSVSHYEYRSLLYSCYTRRIKRSIIIVITKEFRALLARNSFLNKFWWSQPSCAPYFRQIWRTLSALVTGLFKWIIYFTDRVKEIRILLQWKTTRIYFRHNFAMLRCNVDKLRDMLL